MTTFRRHFRLTFLMIAIVTHAFGVVRSVSVGTGTYLFSLSNQLLGRLLDGLACSLDWLWLKVLVYVSLLFRGVLNLPWLFNNRVFDLVR